MEISFKDTLPIGYNLHWYEILAVLGRGAYGITYLALDTNLHRQVALKEYLPVDFAQRQDNDTVQALNPSQEELYQWGLQRFLLEARTLARFSHSNIVRVHSVFEHNNTAYMAMEYEEGENLAAIAAKVSPFSESQLLDIFIPIIDGLSLVHQAGFIHRDIKPSNIYIRSDDTSVLLDFGSARRTLSNRVQSHTSLVTAGYAPFEQYDESNDVQNACSDIYALGASLYFCVTGKKPCSALKRGAALLEGKEDLYEPLTKIRYPDYSEHFLQAINQALQFHGKDRPQDTLLWADMLCGKSPKPEAKTSNDDTLYIEAMDALDAINTLHQPGKGQRKDPSLRNATGRVNARGRRVIDDDEDEGTRLRIRRSAQQAHFNDNIDSFKKRSPTLIFSAILLLGALGGGAYFGYQQYFSPQSDFRIKAEKISQLLAQADKQLRAEKVTSPKEDNAVLSYWQVLELDSNNSEALAGLKKAATYYQQRIENNLEKQQWQQADAQIERLARIPNTQEMVKQYRLALKAKPGQPPEASEDPFQQQLARANKLIDKNWLTKPAGNNALDIYQQILAQEPEHNEAQAGVDRIVALLADLAALQLSRGEQQKARQTIAKIENIQPDSPHLTTLQQNVGEQAQKQDKNEELETYLALAQRAHQSGYLVTPEKESAAYYYRQILILDPKHTIAREGLSKVRQNYIDKFDLQLENDLLPEAQTTLQTLAKITPPSQLKPLRDRLATKQSDAGYDPNIELAIINDVLEQFKASLESGDLNTLESISQFKQGRKDALTQFLQQHHSYALSVDYFNHISNEHRAIATVSLSNFINNQGDPVEVGDWQKIQIAIEKDAQQQWLVHW